MPNVNYFKTKEERLAYWADYREKNRAKLRAYNTAYVREWRKNKTPAVAGEQPTKVNQVKETKDE